MQLELGFCRVVIGEEGKGKIDIKVIAGCLQCCAVGDVFDSQVTVVDLSPIALTCIMAVCDCRRIQAINWDYESGSEPSTA